jgi:hypothetical protein
MKSTDKSGGGSDPFAFLTPEEEDDIFKDLQDDAEEDPGDGLPLLTKVTEDKRARVLQTWNK